MGEHWLAWRWRVAKPVAYLGPERIESASQTATASSTIVNAIAPTAEAPRTPRPEILAEVGRVTIAGSRLDLQMGFLWHHLDPSLVLEDCRCANGAKQCEAVDRLARNRLTGDMHNEVLACVAAAEDARRRRNDVIHQDWVLRGREAFRFVGDLAKVEPESLAEYLAAWERESKESGNWQRVPPHGVDVVSAQTSEDLRLVERQLADATSRVEVQVFRVASSRETGIPPGYIHPPI